MNEGYYHSFSNMKNYKLKMYFDVAEDQRALLDQLVTPAEKFWNVLVLEQY